MSIVLKNIEIPDGTRWLDASAADGRVDVSFRGDTWTASVNGWEHQWTWQVLVFKDELKPMDGEIGVNVPVAFTGGNTNHRSTALAHVVDTLTEIGEGSHEE